CSRGPRPRAATTRAGQARETRTSRASKTSVKPSALRPNRTNPHAWMLVPVARERHDGRVTNEHLEAPQGAADEQPFAHDGGRVGVVLSHGFTGTPASM